MPTLKELVPEADTLLGLDPEELGLILLRVLADPQNQQNGMTHPGTLETRLFPQSGGGPYPQQKTEECLEAVREAFAWLEGQALLIAADPMNTQGGWRKLGRCARRLLSDEAVADYRAASRLPRQILHGDIKENVYFNFQRGDYQTAVYCAFREVEILVARVSGIKGKNGVRLMREAFKPADPHKTGDTAGPLTDVDAEYPEQEARAHLFAGAFGECRNPHSHKEIGLKAEDAVHMLMLASYLHRMLDDAIAKSLR
ncbi:MAG: TIGR02391 family protein [Reyranella sp.]|nr:TIGR02391 family protein [Reyranella sp.]